MRQSSVSFVHYPQWRGDVPLGVIVNLVLVHCEKQSSRDCCPEKEGPRSFVFCSDVSIIRVSGDHCQKNVGVSRSEKAYS